MPAGRVCIVTGASRGIGRGIALVLARDEQHIVYATARSEASLRQLADEVARSGTTGRLVPCAVDHTDDASARGLVDRVVREHGGIDLLVNNAYGGVASVGDNLAKRFWEKPLEVWDASHAVGLRSHYVMSALAAPAMIARRAGLIVNVSSAGGQKYLFDIAYGCGKASLDRLGADTATELAEHGVSVVTLWPGGVKTETTKFPNAETVEFAGRGIAALLSRATPAELAGMTGKIVQSYELAEKYGFTDVDGKMPGKAEALKNRKALSSPPLHWSLSSTLAEPLPKNVAKMMAKMLGGSKL